MNTQTSPWSLTHLATLGLALGAAARGQARGLSFVQTSLKFTDPEPLAFGEDKVIGRIDVAHDGFKPICILSGAIPDTPAYAKLSRDNHQRYAERHGYKYFFFNERVSGDRYVDPSRGDLNDPFGGGLMWQKITALETVAAQRTPRQAPVCRWLMWVDADAVFTNPKMSLENLLHRFGGGRDGLQVVNIILSREETNISANFINSGVFFLRNRPESMSFLGDVTNLYDKYKNRWCPEQGAMQELAFHRDTLHVQPEEREGLEAWARLDIAFAPQRAFNAFRWDRQEGEAFRASLWRPCDFIGHSPSVTGDNRVSYMEDMIAAGDAC